MNTRFDDYTTDNDLETQNLSRYKRNSSLYKRMKEEELDNFDVDSNTQVIENSSNVIDIEKLRDMLDKKYREPKKKVNIDFEKELSNHREVDLDETREYNVNEFISKAHEEDETDYEIERLKKLRNTNIDILNNLNIKSEEKKDYTYGNDKSDESKKLRELIDTITLKEQMANDPLDILVDLKGDDDTTKVLGTKSTSDDDYITKEAPNINGLNMLVDKEESNSEEDDAEDDTNEDLTDSDLFSNSDFDDFKDLQDGTKTKIFVKLLIFIVVLAVLVGLVFFLNKELGLGLF